MQYNESEINFDELDELFELDELNQLDSILDTDDVEIDAINNKNAIDSCPVAPVAPVAPVDINALKKMIIDDVDIAKNEHLMRLEGSLDTFSHETGARLDVLQTSVDSLTTKVSSLESQMNAGSANKATFDTEVVTKLEKRMSVLEGRMMHLEEIFAEQKMLNDQLSTILDADTSSHAVAESKVELELELLHQELLAALDRITSLEDNLERDVAKVTAKVIKEEIIPLISGHN